MNMLTSKNFILLALTVWDRLRWIALHFVDALGAMWHWLSVA